MKTYTLGFLFKDNKIILAKKKRKFGVGKLNGYGGRIEEGEDKSTCLVREFTEESEVILEKENCRELGYVDFLYEGREESNQRVFMFRINEFEGYPVETEEMGKPEEFDLDKVPFEEMIVGDDRFLHFIIKGKKFGGELHLSEDGEKVLSCSIVEIPDEKSNEFKMK